MKLLAYNVNANGIPDTSDEIFIFIFENNRRIHDNSVISKINSFLYLCSKGICDYYRDIVPSNSYVIFYKIGHTISDEKEWDEVYLRNLTEKNSVKSLKILIPKNGTDFRLDMDNGQIRQLSLLESFNEHQYWLAIIILFIIISPIFILSIILLRFIEKRI